jgi:hypothetical protein
LSRIFADRFRMRQRIQINMRTAQVVMLAAAFAALLSAADDPERQRLERALNDRFPAVKLGSDKVTVVQRGTVLVVQAGGIFASPMTEFAFINNFKDGRIKRSAASALIHDSKTSREVMPGERVYLLKTEAKDSGILLTVQTCVACDGSEVDRIQLGFRAAVNFQLPKWYSMNTFLPQAESLIGQVFGVADAGNAAAPPPPPPPPPPGASAENQPAPQPARIAMGQTIDEVTANLGPPDKMVDLGAKKIYLYKDLKITFVDGRVSDVQ